MSHYRQNRRVLRTRREQPGESYVVGEPMRIAFVGTRGVPAKYGGFETAAEEIGKRLVQRGHEVTVYCRCEDVDQTEYEGMVLVHLPAARSKFAETLTHTALSVLDLVRRRRGTDSVIVFNAANAPLLPVLRAGRMPVAVHVDGLEWQRAKWSGLGKRYYRAVEALSVRWADDLIADAAGIQDYYDEEFGASSRLIAYGAPILQDLPSHRLHEVGATEQGYHLVVARFEPENHVDMIVRGYRASGATLPLLVVGSSPYGDEYTAQIEQAAEGDPRIRLLGGVWDQELLDQLYAHAATYLHGHSVGGTNPSLLRAMGAGSAVTAFDVVFNREVLGSTGRWFRDEADVTAEVEHTEADLAAARVRGWKAQLRAEERYDWDVVAEQYEQLCRDLQDGTARRLRRRASGRRLRRSSPGAQVIPMPLPEQVDAEGLQVADRSG